MKLEDYLRYDWKQDEVLNYLRMPLDRLTDMAQGVHQAFADQDVQKCQLLSIKTGGCPEDCSYCSQSARYQTEVGAEPLMSLDRVRKAATQAKKEGATRFCMGSAWKKIPKGKQFESVLGMIQEVSKLDLEVCCTLGGADSEQLKAMKEAGLTSYNHNLDTSREHYPNVVTTRTFDERLQTLQQAREAGVKLCCGGILGMGESIEDRASLIAELSHMKPHPESVPINLLVPVEGTPFEKNESIPFEEFYRTVATTRIVLPQSRVRLSAGRNTLTQEQQLKCFAVGANSIFMGEKLLTTDNVAIDSDKELYQKIEEQREQMPEGV